MLEELITPEGALPPTGDGQGAGSEAGEAKQSIKDILSKELGKDFPTDEAALKAVKDTFSYVGKKTETPEVKIDETKFVSRADFENAMFYKDNPQYDGYKDLIGTIAKAEGKTAAEVVQLDAFKSVYTKASAHDAEQKSKSVLMSNPRLGTVTDKLTQARTAVSEGNYSKASNDAVSAVMDAFELK